MTRVIWNRTLKKPCLLACASLVCAVSAQTFAATDKPNPQPANAAETTISFSEAIAGLQLEQGFMQLYRDPEQGRILALLPAADEHGSLLRLIHAMRLSGGLGSNSVGLDRGWGNSGQLLNLRRIGNRVIAEVENLRYRADTDNLLEQAAVQASFASSFIWSTDIIASNEQQQLLIDLSGLLTSDLLNLGLALREGENSFSLAAERSLPDLPSLLVFPDNVEIDAYMTFSSDQPGAEVSATAADPNHVTLRQHHSFVRLPAAGFQTRKADPRTGTFTLGYYDYATPLSAPLLQGLVMRHRLQHVEPGNADSGVRKPIVFYIDAGAPTDIQQALREGASWWQTAFAAAGFADGFRVEILPADVHPLDIRYNTVQWVHRQTRGWSYGGGIIDPRTGEFIKGHVILGSQRIRHDRMIFEGLAGTTHSGTGSADDPVQLALNRIRQLAAHEVGHALGFGHNFAASSNDRASVMDYPAPWVQITADHELDFSRAYTDGIGAWDILTARWLYTEFTHPETEQQQLHALLEKARHDGLLFVTDEHARGIGTAHPQAAVWDNGNDAVTELDNVLAVRQLALQNFDSDQIQQHRPLAALREVLTPIYLYHRYQLNAVAKPIGGLYFDYRQPTNGAKPAVRIASAEQQERAIQALLQTLNAQLLNVPEDLLQLLPPVNHGLWFEVPEEGFQQRTGVAFDLLAAAETAADLSYAALLDPQRLERLQQFHLRDQQLPGVRSLLDRIEQQLEHQISAYADADSANDRRLLGLAAVLQQRYVAALLQVHATATSASLAVSLQQALQQLQQRLLKRRAPASLLAQRQWLAQRIEQQLQRPAPATEPLPPMLATPPGSPIGASMQVMESCWHCPSQAH